MAHKSFSSKEQNPSGKKPGPIPQNVGEVRETFRKMFELLKETATTAPTEVLANQSPQELLEKMEQDMEQLSKSSETVASKLGLSREEIETYVSNPKNFSPEEWKALQGMKADIDEFRESMENRLKGIEEKARAASEPRRQRQRGH